VLLPPENQFSHSFSQTIWRIIPHPIRNEWAVELRDVDRRTVSWALLDLTLSTLRWQSTPEATDWWSTLTAFTGDALYLHNYRYPDIPEPTDLLAVLATDGTLNWILPGWLLVADQPEPNALIVAKKLPESTRYQLCDPQTGLLQAVIQESNLPSSPPPDYRAPVRYEPRDIYFDVLSSFLEKTVGVHSPIAIDYLESNPYLVFSYYLYEQEKVAQYLLIANRAREILYHERLSENRQGVGRDTILYKSGCLVCLRNSSEFISLKLPPL
jgi:hypothetical protein